MAQYKVPQDVEADDKLLGPFSFRQFVYLLIAGGLIALAVGLFQLFPLLAIIPIPFVLLLAALALPLKKDQPMETYLAAIVSYYLKPRTRKWMPGQKDTAILITAPKIQPEEEMRARDISGEEATHRLSFLADIVDTEGYAIKGAGVRKLNEDVVAEANAMNDIFETTHFNNLENTITKDENEQREKVVQELKDVIEETEQIGETKSVGAVGTLDYEAQPIESQYTGAQFTDPLESFAMQPEIGPDFASSVVVVPGSEVETEPVEKTNRVKKDVNKGRQIKAKPSIIELANNPDFTVATISKEANRLKERDEGEVFISLH